MLAPARSLAHSPVFQVMLALQNTPDIAFALPGLKTSLLTEDVETAQFDLSLDLREVGGRIKGRLYFATALFDAATAQRYLDYWHALLRGMTADPHQPVQTLPLLTDAERRQLLFGFNATRADYPVGDALHLLFEGQAERQPDATAVECDGERLSYGALNRRANQLAHGLIERGVHPDGRVAIVLERGCDLIVAMLATLKAGGAMCRLTRRRRPNVWPICCKTAGRRRSSPAMRCAADSAHGRTTLIRWSLTAMPARGRAARRKIFRWRRWG
nr:AMP-binding protein [Lonsdalea britannica]